MSDMTVEKAQALLDNLAHQPGDVGASMSARGLEALARAYIAQAAELTRLRARIDALQSERPFIVGANHGYETAMEQVADLLSRAEKALSALDRISVDPVLDPLIDEIRTALSAYEEAQK